MIIIPVNTDKKYRVVFDTDIDVFENVSDIDVHLDVKSFLKRIVYYYTTYTQDFDILTYDMWHDKNYAIVSVLTNIGYINFYFSQDGFKGLSGYLNKNIIVKYPNSIPVGNHYITSNSFTEQIPEVNTYDFNIFDVKKPNYLSLDVKENSYILISKDSQSVYLDQITDIIEMSHNCKVHIFTADKLYLYMTTENKAYYISLTDNFAFKKMLIFDDLYTTKVIRFLLDHYLPNGLFLDILLSLKNRLYEMIKTINYIQRISFLTNTVPVLFSEDKNTFKVFLLSRVIPLLHQIITIDINSQKVIRQKSVNFSLKSSNVLNVLLERYNYKVFASLVKEMDTVDSIHLQID
ncbi:MAG: hypothetical protein QXP36_00060 [Conexivisphaerales archaeon]